MNYYLVQRLVHRNPENPDRGFDGFFTMDYMGSSEYEFSTPNQSLKSMRARTLELFESKINGRSVYFVCDSANLERKVAELREWLKDPRSKEMSYFPELFDESNRYEWMERVNAWWSFEDDIAWSLDAEIAARLLLAFETRAKK